LLQRQLLGMTVEVVEQEARFQEEMRRQREQHHIAQMARDAEDLHTQEADIQELLFTMAIQRHHNPNEARELQKLEHEMESKLESHQKQERQWTAKMEQQDCEKQRMLDTVKKQESHRQELLVALEQHEERIRELQVTQQGEERIAALLAEQSQEVQAMQKSLTGEESMAMKAVQYSTEIKELQQQIGAAPRPSVMLQTELRVELEAKEVEAWRKSEMQVASQVKMKDAEVEKLRQLEEERSRRIAMLESELQAAAAAVVEVPPPVPTPPPVPEQPPMDEVKIVYHATGDDELDKSLEKQLMAFGPDPLRGNTLVRTQPGSYKLMGPGDTLSARVKMKLDGDAVTVREGNKWVGLGQWLQALEPAGHVGTGDDLFDAMNQVSPYAQHV